VEGQRKIIEIVLLAVSKAKPIPIPASSPRVFALQIWGHLWDLQILVNCNIVNY